MKRCLTCYKDMSDAPHDGENHVACARRIFGSDRQPEIDIDLRHLRESVFPARLHGAVPGVQAKLSLARDRSAPATILTIVGFQGEYILKVAQERLPELPANEDVTMHLAELLGLRVADHTLVRTTSGDLAYLTRRFDRKLRGRRMERIAVEDMCQLAGKLTEQKYMGSMELIARLTRKYATYPAIELRTLFEVTLFCFLTGNSDMHLKNFSLLTERTGAIHLAPCYDLLSTTLAMPEDSEETALTLDQKKRNITRNDMDSFGEYCGLTASDRAGVYQRVIRVLPAWKTCIDVSFLSPLLKRNYNTLLEERFDQMRLPNH